MTSISHSVRYYPHELNTRYYAIKLYRSGCSIKFVCRRYKISKASLMRWNKTFDGSKESLIDKSHVPKTKHPNSHTDEELKWIKDYIRRNPNITGFLLEAFPYATIASGHKSLISTMQGIFSLFAVSKPATHVKGCTEDAIITSGLSFFAYAFATRITFLANINMFFILEKPLPSYSDVLTNKNGMPSTESSLCSFFPMLTDSELL